MKAVEHIVTFLTVFLSRSLKTYIGWGEGAACLPSCTDYIELPLLP
jgi:hypothetical protein